MKHTRLTALLGALAMFFATAIPANASLLTDTSVTMFTGTAVVCVTNGGWNAACPASESSGLTLPGPGQHIGYYQFESRCLGPVTVCPDPSEPDCVTISLTGPVKGCDISVDGKLGPVLGIGAACGWSHGHSGVGTLTTGALATGSPLNATYNLDNVGWVFSFSTILPLTGSYSLAAGGKTGPFGIKPAVKRVGPLVGVVQASGGTACLNADGASEFNVVGVVAAL